MKESISYSFLLNIVILFIFVCAAIIGGILSYYRAFRANTIIVNEIEKFEGYNCESIDSISKKLNSISYNLPFNATCKNSYGKPCKESDDGNYVIVAYNLDVNSKIYLYDDEMNSSVKVDVGDDLTSSGTKQYQFGVYTYMYIDLPVISQILKIPFFSKTKVLYEFRDLRASFEDETYTSLFGFNYDIVPDDVKNYIDSTNDTEKSEKKSTGDPDIDNVLYIFENLDSLYNRSYLDEFSYRLLVNKQEEKFIYGYDPSEWGMGEINNPDYNLRDAYKYYGYNTIADINNVLTKSKRECGYVTDWSLY